MMLFKISVLMFTILVTLTCSYVVYKTWQQTDGQHTILSTGLAILYLNALLYAIYFCRAI